MSREREIVESMLERAKVIEFEYLGDTAPPIGDHADAAAPDPLAEIRAAIVADLEAGPAAIDAAAPPRWISYPRLPVCGAALAAPGATGKTTLVLSEMVHIAAGLQLYGSDVDQPGEGIYVSAEDGAAYPNYLLQRILVDGHQGGFLTERAVNAAKATIHVVGWSRTKYGPILAVDELGETRVRPVWPLFLELIERYKPVYVTLDPSVLFGPGERHGNDAAAAFAALMHETAQQLGALVQTVDHVAQSVARGGIVDQYASRGGTGKVDESRLARQLVRVGVDTEEPLPLGVTSNELAQGRVLQLHWTKPSYAPRPPAAWLRRRGYWFEFLRVSQAADEQDMTEQNGIVEAIREVIASGDYVPAAAQGPRTALHVLSAARSFPEALKSRAGKRRFWAHIETLRRNRTLRESSMRRDNRHVVATLVLEATQDEAAPNASY